MIDLIYFLALLCVLLILLIFSMTHFSWILRQLRDICKDEVGYVKLIQLAFVFIIFISFLTLLAYNLIYREETSKLDIFLTVVVGLIGTIVGTFFSERTMESLKKDKDLKKREIIRAQKELKDFILQLNDLTNK